MVTRKLKLIFLGVVLLWIPFVTRVAGKYFHSDIHDNCIKYLISLVLQSLITAFDTAWSILLVQQTLTEILLRKRTQRAVVNFSGRFTIIMRATSSNFNRFQGTNSPQCGLVENTMLSPQLETGEKLFIRKQVANVYLIQETSWKKKSPIDDEKNFAGLHTLSSMATTSSEAGAARIDWFTSHILWNSQHEHDLDMVSCRKLTTVWKGHVKFSANRLPRKTKDSFRHASVKPALKMLSVCIAVVPSICL